MKAKQVLFLLPGFLCDERVWKEQIKALEPYAEIVIPSFSGLNTLKSKAQHVLDQAPERFSVIGHSLGGRIAFEIIHMAEERIDKFVVMDTGVHPVQSGEMEKRQVLLDIARDEGMPALAKHWAAPIVSPDRKNDTELVSLIEDMAESFSLQDCENQMAASLTREDQSLYLRKIQKPVLLICGDQDAWSPVSQHEEMQEDLKYSTLEVIKGCGHMTLLEKPVEVNKILMNWFKAEGE